LLAMKGKLRSTYAVIGIAAICLLDMWMVNKRYLNDAMFVERSVREMPMQMTATDQQILEDKSLDYRVLNLASNTFNENETSYFHKSIGGYHPAKLRRYQELIEAHIAPEMQQLMPAIAEAQGDMTQVAGDSIYPVLNMLNMKYVIVPLQGGQTVPIMNPYAYGNAWFVDKLTYVENANAELDQLGKMDLRHEAVADAKFKEQLGDAVEQDTASVVTLTAYEPNELKYNVRSGKGGVVVFSEIYYPGWTATVDGAEAELGRVNYVLRALNLKPGEHEVVLTFKPRSIQRTETIAYAASLLLLLAVLGSGWFLFKRKKK
ncbi:MAG: YfhO family protein, partial [Prevotella sp.]|nr:YfhO family protein [Prevotella sp.]